MKYEITLTDMEAKMLVLIAASTTSRGPVADAVKAIAARLWQIDGTLDGKQFVYWQKLGCPDFDLSTPK